MYHFVAHNLMLVLYKC